MPCLWSDGQQLARLVPAGDLDADEEVRRARVRIAVIELRDTALAQQRAELAEAARALRNRHREDRLARLAQFGALGDEAQAVEIHVRAAGDGDERPVTHAVRLAPALDARDGQRARGLEDRARVLEHVLDRRACRVRVDAAPSRRRPARQPERFLPDLLDRHTVRKQPHVRQRHAAAGRERARHRVRIDRLHADDPDFRADALHVRGDPGDQPATAHRDENRVDRALPLAQDLHADRALTCDHIRIVVGMDERRVPRLSAARVRARRRPNTNRRAGPPWRRAPRPPRS